jgi:hypothetical protein
MKLKNLLTEAETFTATNKSTGKTSVFKTKDTRDAAVKAGTHAAIEDPNDSKKSATPKVNIFDKPAESPKETESPKADNVIKGLKPAKYGGKHPDSMESGGSLFRTNRKGEAVRDREVRLKDITPEDITTTEKLFGVDLSKGIENGLDYETNDLIIQTKRLQQFQKGGEFENQKAYDSLLSNIKSYSAKDYNKKIAAAEKKKASSAKYASNYDNPTYWKDDERSDSSGFRNYDDEEDDSWSDDAQLTADRLDKVEKALEDEIKLNANGFTTSRESGGGSGGWEGPMQIYDKSSDNEAGDPPVISLSVGSPENDGTFSIVFADADGNPYFEPNYDALTGNNTLEPQNAYKVTKALMKMPEVQKVLKGEMSIDEFQPIYDKLKSKFSKGKTESIKLKELLEADTFTATNKASGKTSVFKTKASRDAAIKAGTHDVKKDASSEKGSKTTKTNIFNTPSEKPKADGMETVNAIAAGTGLRAQAIAGWADENGVNLSKVAADLKSKKLKPMDMMTAVVGKPGNKYAKSIIAKYSQSGGSKSEPKVKSSTSTPASLGVDKVVYNTRTKTVGIVRMADERGETKTDADGNVNTSASV